LTDVIPPEISGSERGAIAHAQLHHPQAIRAIFMDAGYTMLEPHPSVIEIAAGAVASLGLPTDPACLQRQLPIAESAMRANVRAAPQTWSDPAAIEAVWHSYFEVLLGACLADRSAYERTAAVTEVLRRFDHFASYALYPDVVSVLRLLHARGYTLGVISDWGISLGSILHAHGLNQYFDFAVVSAALRHAKPHPDLFETALRRADAIPDYAVHVGDSYVLDMLGARAAGIQGILIDRKGKLDPAVVDVPVIRDLYGLLDLLEIESEVVEDVGGA
jgi:HAD superfamily hydrolase (TIGR01549 family)